MSIHHANSSIAVASSDPYSASGLKWQPMISDLLESLLPHQRSVLGLLAISHQLNLNPSTLLKQLGCELPGNQSADAMRLAAHLDEGKELLQTLEQYPGLIPAQAVVLLRLAKEEGSLSEVYAQVSQRFPRISRTQDSSAGAGFGLAIKVLFVFNVIGFLSLKVFPEFTMILDEFGVESGKFVFATFLLDRIAFWMGILALLFGLFALIWLLVRGIKIYYGYRPWQQHSISRGVSRKRFLASLAHTGILGRLLDRFSSSPALNRLLPRLNSVRNGMLQGRDAWSALADQRLVSRADANLVSSASPETQAWLMRWKATRQEDRIQLNWTVGRRMVWTMVHIGLVLLVFLTCFRVFGALIDIMDTFSKW